MPTAAVARSAARAAMRSAEMSVVVTVRSGQWRPTGV
jgi:hypothetical protein